MDFKAIEPIYGSSKGGVYPNDLDQDCDEEDGTPSPEPDSDSDSDAGTDIDDEDQDTEEIDDNGDILSSSTSPISSQPPGRTGLANSALVDLTEVEEDDEEDKEQPDKDEVLDITQMLRTRNFVFERRAANAIQQSSSESPSVDTFPPRRAYSERDALTLGLLGEARKRLRNSSLFVTPGPLEEFTVSVSATPSPLEEAMASLSATPGPTKRVVVDLTMMDSDDEKENGTLVGGAGPVPKREPNETSPARGTPRYETLSEGNAYTTTTTRRPLKRPASLSDNEPMESCKRQKTKFEE